MDMTKRRDPNWLEFDLLYRRFISRIEVTLFNEYFYSTSENLDVSSVRFSEDGVGWIGFQVSVIEKVKALLLLLNP